MEKQDIKDRLEDAVETTNPPGTDYYGAELDEAEVEAAKERMEESLKSSDEAQPSPHRVIIRDPHPR